VTLGDTASIPESRQDLIWTDVSGSCVLWLSTLWLLISLCC